MPIDIKQFKEATKPLAERVRDFLSSHPDQAYSVVEIIAALEGYADLKAVSMVLAVEGFSGQASKTWEKYSSALEELVGKQEISQAQMRGTTYYGYVPRKS